MLETNRPKGASLTVGTRLFSGKVLTMRRVLILAGSVLVVPAFATAQHHRGMVASGQPIVVSPHMAARPVQPAGARVAIGMHGGTTGVIVHRTGVNGTVRRTVNIANLPAFRTESADVPGLGFDFPHMAAVSGLRRRERFEGNSFGFSGFLLSPPAVIVEEGQPVENQPVVEEIAAANAAEGEDVRGSERRNFSGTLSAPAPQQDAAEYVFVRRDGGLVFAVAYSWDHGTLRYITREGLRGSVKQGALDMDATQQFNEQRGVDFRLPA
jgi:hypothetical protein